MKNIISADEKYYLYLKKRSLIGYIYRRYFLYPRICKGLHGRLLDFGCGIGDFLNFYTDSVGVDKNKKNVEYCMSRGLQAEYLVEGKIPFVDASFNSAVMDNVLEHISENEVEQVLQEVIRILEPGGTLLIGVPGLKGYESDEDHKHYYSENDLVSLLAEFGCIRNKTLHMPFHFPHVGNYLRQYCTYVLFEKG